MAVHKAKRSNPLAQPQPKSARPRPNQHQLKAEFFETLHHLNRGYGIALAALDRLETKDRQHRPSIFPAGCLRDYRNRTEALRAVANRDLLRLIAGREDRAAGRFGRLTGQRAKPDTRSKRHS